jgi:hypothetical protein
MKRLLLFTFCLTAYLLPVSGQGIVIHQKDGTLAIFSSDQIEDISMITEDYSLIIGTWYLGYKKNGEDIVHYDGSEYMAFAGKELVWGGKGGDPDTYTVIRYDAKNKYFLAKNNNKSQTLKWYINKQTDKMLVLRDGEVFRYFYKSKEAADKALLEKDPPSHKETTDINTILKYASGKTKSTKTPMGKHFENRHVTTDKDRAWLLDPANEPNKVGDLTTWKKKTVKLYPYTDPVPADVNQHAIGNCCAMSVLASFAYLYPDFIKHILTDNGDGTYTIQMYDPQGEPVSVCISNKFLCDSNGNLGQVTGKNNAVTWATILEKALMKWETLYEVDGVEGIGTEHVAPLFTGDGESFAFESNSLHTSELKLAIEWSLEQGNITIGGFNVGDILCGTLKTVTGHAFTFMLSTSEDILFAMRNPWGNGDKGEDGLLLIPDERAIVQTIDVRIVMPGAAAPYLRKDLQPYTPPRYIRRPTDLGVAPRLLNRMYTHPNATELW